MTSKLISDMKLKDFIERPIWTWLDDDTDMVMPVKYRGHLPENHDALFIYCQLNLNDDTKTIGVISVRVSNREVYVIKFFDQNEKGLDFPLQKTLRNETSISLLTRFLGKDFEKIFPLKFKTEFSFLDGQRLEGEIYY